MPNRALGIGHAGDGGQSQGPGAEVDEDIAWQNFAYLQLIQLPFFVYIERFT